MNDLSTEEHLLIKALISSESINNLIQYLPEFREDILIIQKSLEKKRHLDTKDLLNQLIELKSVIIELHKALASQKYEEGAKLRDKERQIYETLGFKLDPIRTERLKKLGVFNDNDVFLPLITEFKEYLVNRDIAISNSPLMALLIQPGTASPKEIGNLLSELSKLYRMIGGSGITFKLDEVRDPKFQFDYE